MPGQPDPRSLEQLLGAEQVRAWEAKLTEVFFDQDARRQFLAAVRAGLAGQIPEEQQDAVVRQLCWLTSCDARRPEPEAPPAAPLLSGAALRNDILDHYPHPIASAYHALIRERTHATRLGCLLDTYECLIHYLGTVAVSAYLRTDLAHADCNRRLLDFLLKGAWSTGDLFALLADTVRLAGDCGGLLPYAELPGYLFTRGRPSASHEVLHSFIALRNRCWGHATGRTEEFFAQVLQGGDALPPNQQRLEEELARLSWLKHGLLLRPVDIDDEGRVRTADVLRGSTYRGSDPMETRLQLDAADLRCNGGTVWPDQNSLLLVAPDATRYVPLFPLALFRFHTGSEGAYFLQRCTWRTAQAPWRLKKAFFVLYRSRVPEHEETAWERTAASLERYAARLASTAPAEETAIIPAPDDEAAEYDLPEVRVEQESHLRQFVGREGLLQDLAGWIDRQTEGGYLLLLGPPGQGKSALMAELARREGEPGRGGCLLHMVKSHRQPLRFLPFLLSQAAKLSGKSLGPDAYRGGVEDLRNSLVGALEAVRERAGRAVVVLDALDELDAAGERLTFLPPRLTEGVRVVLSCRPDIPLVMALRARLRGLEERHVEPLIEADFRLLLERRLEAEVVRTLTGQVDLAALFRRLGGNPLFLHYFADYAAREWAPALPALLRRLRGPRMGGGRRAGEAAAAGRERGASEPRRPVPRHLQPHRGARGQPVHHGGGPAEGPAAPVPVRGPRAAGHRTADRPAGSGRAADITGGVPRPRGRDEPVAAGRRQRPLQAVAPGPYRLHARAGVGAGRLPADRGGLLPLVGATVGRNRAVWPSPPPCTPAGGPALRYRL